MTTFAYTALDPSGKRKTGFVDAATREAAMAAIQAEGRFVVDLKEQEGRSGATLTTGVRRKGGKAGRADLALFTRRLADLSDAGLPLDRVLQVVGEQSESAAIADVAEQALDEVRAGRPVSDALAMHPKLFPQVYTQTLRAGEASGQFPQVASRLADFQEKEVTRRSLITSAMIYPAILATTAVLVIVFLLTFVVPRLSGVFKDLGSDLPLSTQILLGMTGFLTKRGLYLIGGIIVAIFAYRAWVATEQGAYMRDSLLLKVPAAGPIIQKATISRFARVLGTLVYGGVPILESLNLAGLAAGNRVFLRGAQQVEQEVREGRPIAGAMRDAGGFPPVLTHMVAIGEETGDLPKMLSRVSDSLDFEVDNGMRRAIALLEPIIVLGMGGFVGFVVLSVLLPIYASQDLVK
jgi:type II secretory pathway component PulF